jgi:hypothetical protein
LAGLLILPAAFRLLLETMSAPRLRWGVMSAAAAASAGVFLVHYRVVMFLALLIVAYLVSSTIIHLAPRPLWRSLPAWIGRIGIVAAGAMLLASPWFIMVTRTIIAPLAAGGHAPPTPLDSLPWGYLDPASGRAVYILALLGLAYSALRARWFGLMLTLWTALLYLSANKGVVALPGMGGVNQNSVDIVLFIPLCILAGWVVGDGLMTLASRLPVRWRWSLAGAVVIAVSGLAIIGAQRLIPLVGPTTVLIRQADLPALAWAEAHLPADAEVLINPFLWGYGIYAGQDGGYYLTPLAGRATVPPPVLYAEGPRPRIETILEISRQVENLGRDAPGLRRLMDAHGLTHVFLGRRGGVISPKALKQSDLFEVIYDHDGVTIFKTH